MIDEWKKTLLLMKITKKFKSLIHGKTTKDMMNSRRLLYQLLKLNVPVLKGESSRNQNLCLCEREDLKSFNPTP